MAAIPTKTIGRWLTWGLVAAIALSLLFAYLRRDPLPWTIHVASGEQGGQYYFVGESIGASLYKRTGHRVLLHATQGTLQNYEHLRKGEAHLAVMQAGATTTQGVVAVTPLYPEAVLIVTRRSRDLHTPEDLEGRNVALGKKGSGMRANALALLRRLEIDASKLGESEHYFLDLLDHDDLDAAIVTTGIENRDLHKVLASGRFQLMPIVNAEAVEMRDPHLRHLEIPRGLFRQRPPLPAEPLPTLATTAYLMVRQDAPDALVSAALRAVHESGLREKIPTIFSRRTAASHAASHAATPLHSIAQRYFHPSDEIGWMANVMESLAAGKELLFALGAGIYLLWRRWVSLKKQETQAAISRQKEHLDTFLEETLSIERAQMQTTDPEKLREYLDKVTQIKLRALHEFTEEELRGDRVFAIFLAQCANLISKLQLAILVHTRNSADDLEKREPSAE